MDEKFFISFEKFIVQTATLCRGGQQLLDKAIFDMFDLSA
jgi:hypothetical protein